MAGAKESKYYDEAERLYVAGHGLERIAELLPEPVSVACLSNWSRKGDWPAQRKAAISSLRNVAELLMEILEEKIVALKASGKLDGGCFDEIAKATASIERLKRGAYDFRTVAVEVMGRFAEFLVKNGTPGDTRRLVAEQMQSWFAQME